VHPILFRIPLPNGGHFDIATYGFMLALGTLAGVFTAMRFTKREGLSSETIIDLGFWTVIAGVLGAKLWFIIQFWGSVDDKMDLLRNFRSGLVFYGGVVGAAIVIAWFAKYKRFSILQMLDVAAPSGMLGLAFGRIGCFFNGCCYGVVTNSSWGVRYPKMVDGDTIVGSPAFIDQLNAGLVHVEDTLSKPAVPTQLIECASVLAVFAIVLLLRRGRKFFGEQFTLTLVLYAIVRFSVEFFRGDNEHVLGILTIAQVFSIAMFVIGAAGYAYLRGAKPASLAVAGVPAAQAKAPEQAKAKGGKKA